MIISAGANGIGLSIARLFAANDASVAICDVDEEASANVGIEFDFAIVSDVTNADAMEGFVKGAVSRLGGMTAVITNTGTAGPTANLENIAAAEWTRTIAVNLTDQYTLCRAAVPYLKGQKQGALILSIGLCGNLETLR